MYDFITDIFPQNFPNCILKQHGCAPASLFDLYEYILRLPSCARRAPQQQKRAIITQMTNVACKQNIFSLFDAIRNMSH